MTDPGGDPTRADNVPVPTTAAVEHPGPARPRGTAPFLPDRWWAMPVRRRRQVAALVVAVVVLVPLATVWVLSSDGGDDVEATPVTSEADAFVAALPPERVATWDQLAECESGGDWSRDTGNGFYGGLQFTQQSWEAVGGTGSPAAASRNEQIMRAEMLFDDQGWEAWPNCSRTLGLV